MTETSLNQLSQSTATIAVGSATCQISPIKLGQLTQMLELCAPILQLTIDREAELQANFDNALVDLVMQDVATFKEIISQVAQIEPAEIEQMTIDQLVFAIGVIIGQNPVFFSHFKTTREKLKAAQTASQ